MQQLTESQLQELRVNFAFWQAIEMVAGRAYPKTDAFNVIVADAAHFGALDGVRSAWARSCHEAVKAGKIRMLQPEPPPIEVDDEFRDQVRLMRSSDLLKRLNTDPTFKAKFDALALEESQPRQSDSTEYELTATQWRSLPPHVAAVKMRDPKFRAAVDRLIEQGSI